MDIFGLPENDIDTVSDIDDICAHNKTPARINTDNYHKKLMMFHRMKRTFGICLQNENSLKINREDYIRTKNFNDQALRNMQHSKFGPSESMIYRYKIKHVLEMKRTNAHRRLLWKKKLNFIKLVSPEQQVQLLSSLHGEQLTILSSCSKTLAYNITNNVLFEKIHKRIKQTQIFRNLDPIIFQNLPSDYHTKNGTTIRKTTLEKMKMQIDSPETIYYSDRLEKKCAILIEQPITVLYELLGKMTPLTIYILCLWSNSLHKKLMLISNEKSKLYQKYRMGKLYHVLALDDIEKIERIKHNYTIDELEIGIHKYGGFKYTIKAIAQHLIEPPLSTASCSKLLFYDNYDFSLAYLYCFHDNHEFYKLIAIAIAKQPKLSYKNVNRAFRDYFKFNPKVYLYDDFQVCLYLKAILHKYEFFIYSHIFTTPSIRRWIQTAQLRPYECLYDNNSIHQSDRLLSRSVEMCFWRIKNRRWLSHDTRFAGRLYEIREEPQTYDELINAMYIQ